MKRVLAPLVLAVVLAGCTAPEAEPVDAVDLETPGTVYGVVLDAGLRPVADAQISVPAADADATTDDGGAFLLSLPAGQHVLQVRADGFEALVRPVTVHAGARSDVNVTLARLPPPPRVEVQDFQGFIQCDLIVQPTHQHGNGHQHNNQRCDPLTLEDDRHVWELPLRAGADGLVVELAWEPNTDLAEFLYVRVEATDGTLLADHEAPGPLRVQVAQAQLREHVPDGGTLRVVALVGTGEDSGGNDLGLALQFQQEFEAFASVFYGATPPPDYFLLR